MKFVPHEYQKEGVRWLVQHAESALLWEPGLGKTAVTLTALRALQHAGGVRRALIVAPLRVAYAVWSQVGEVGRWDDFAGLRVALLHGPHKAEELVRDADVYVINYDGLLWLCENEDALSLGTGTVPPGGQLKLKLKVRRQRHDLVAKTLGFAFDPPSTSCSVTVFVAGEQKPLPGTAAEYAKPAPFTRRTALADGDEVVVLIYNHGTAPVSVKKARLGVSFRPWLMDLLGKGVDLLVLDELSKLKHPQARRFRMLKPWLGRFKRRWGLTGTPASNGLIDLFGQAYCLDLGRALGRFITHYRRDFFTPTGFGGYTWVPQRDAEARIFARIAPLAQSLKAVDCLDLPELVERDVWVELPDAARAAYKALEDELLAVVNDVTLTAANAAVALSKCRQLCGGAVYHDVDALVATRRDVRTYEAIHDAKIEALTDLVDELQGQPLLVAYEFQHELERIRAALGTTTPALRGGATPREVALTIEAWNNGALPVLLAHPAAAGHGLNLQRGGSHICWYTLTFDLELYEQLNHRIWRQGNVAARVVAHRLLARRTVDVDVRDALARKRGGQDALFAALRRRTDGADDA